MFTQSAARLAAGLAVLAVLAFGAPAPADQVVTLLSHTDEISIMGQKTPAQDIRQEYWFGAEALRFDSGDTSVVIQPTAKKLYFANHADKSYSAMDLPLDFKQLVPPEMAPMMEQMMGMMTATVQVTPTDRTGKFGGYSCKYSTVDVSMAMMKLSMDTCTTEDLPIDYSRYRSLYLSQAEMMPNIGWMREMAEKLTGFPIRQDTTTTMMGKPVKSWQELQSVEERAAPAGFYGPPAGYREVEFNPMAQGQQQRGRKR